MKAIDRKRYLPLECDMDLKGDTFFMKMNVLRPARGGAVPQVGDVYELYEESWKRRCARSCDEELALKSNLLGERRTGRRFIVTTVKPDDCVMKPIAGRLQVWHVESRSCVRLREF